MKLSDILKECLELRSLPVCTWRGDTSCIFVGPFRFVYCIYSYKPTAISVYIENTDSDVLRVIYESEEWVNQNFERKGKWTLALHSAIQSIVNANSVKKQELTDKEVVRIHKFEEMF